MRRQKLMLVVFLVISALAHALLLSQIDGAEPAPVQRGSEIAVTLSPPAPQPEPATEEEKQEDIEVAPEPALPLLAEPMVEPLAIPEEALPPIDPRHEIAMTEYDPSLARAPPAVVPGDGASEDIVRQWLQRHKRYPRVAVIRHIEGEVTLYLRLDPKGRVVASEIRQSSGEALLDEAVLDMVRRADPFPLVAGASQTETEYIVPIDFRLED